MFDTLFGMPLAARFFIAFLVVLALIGVTAWLVRRFGANRLGGGAARGRQPRLAVIDAATVDGRRRLVLIRRDNIEHLLMIGGPTDLVVEPNIVRAAGAAREPVRGVASEIPARGAAAADNSWPLQPLNEPAPAAPARAYRTSATEEPWLAPEPGARPRPAENLSPLPVEPPTRYEAPRLDTPRHEPRITGDSGSLSQSDQNNLAEMAQQLEAALRRAPAPEGRPPVTDPLAAQVAAPKAVEPTVRAPLRDFKPRVEPKFEPPKLENPEPKAESRFVPKSEQKPEPKFEPRAQVKPEPKVDTKAGPSPAPDKSLYDNLEEEMASLLGRPSGKS
jgi:flagellar protein FliO/FliZ